MSTGAILYGGLTAAGAQPTVAMLANSTDAGYTTSWAADGDAGTIWQAGSLVAAVDFSLDYGADVTISALAVTGHTAYSATLSGPYISVFHSPDNATWATSVSGVFTPLTADGNYAVTFTAATYAVTFTAATDRYWRVLFGGTGPPVYGTKLRVADLQLGAALIIPEPTDFGFKALGYKLVTRDDRNATGACLGGQLVDHVTNRVKMKIGPQGISNADFFESGTTLPSWDHFVRTWWSLGKPFTYVPIVPDTAGEPAPYVYRCRAPADAKIKTPFLSSWRRKLDIEFDCLAQDLQT
jgi:hypothetical protein